MNNRPKYARFSYNQVLGSSEVLWGFTDRANNRPFPIAPTKSYEFGRQLHAIGLGYTREGLDILIYETTIWRKT